MKIAWVFLRYGEHILGGAEYHGRLMIEQLMRWNLAQVDVLTTTATVHFQPSNDLPAGVEVVNGVRVLRFPIAHQFYDLRRHQELSYYHFYRSSGLSTSEENEWARHMPFSAALCAWLDAHQSHYDAIIVMPYYYAFHAALVSPHKTYVWACLHDEPPAYTRPVMRMLNRSRGVIFNTEPELALARRLGMTNPNVGIVALGITPLSGSAERFWAQREDRRPFLLYAGRLESGKNVAELYQRFIAFKERHPSPLVLRLLGKGPEAPPEREDIVVEGFVPAAFKADVMAAALAHVAPSKAESLSLSLLEAWTVGTPSIVNGQCEVLRFQVTRCGGGYFYTDQESFDNAVLRLVNNPQHRDEMGERGRRFVQQHYTWSRALKAFMEVVS